MDNEMVNLILLDGVTNYLNCLPSTQIPASWDDKIDESTKNL